MTTWKPNLEGRDSPIYLAIVTALAEDVSAGRLAEGARLPTHRELADTLGVTVGTVTRAYAEAHRRHLIAGEVGRGTFVRGGEKAEGHWLHFMPSNPELVDLSIARPVAPLAPEALGEALEHLARQGDLRALFDYQSDVGMAAHRAALAEWLTGRGLPCQANQIVITSGAENGISTVLSAIAHPDDMVLCEALTYPGIKAVAALQHLRLQGVAMDEQGLLPDAFEQACRAGPVRALYTIPTMQNPTSGLLPLERRQAIAEIARRHDVTIIEDEVFGFLEPEQPPRIATLAPERTVYIASFSKVIAGGLRVGFAVAPPALVPRIGHALHTSLILVAPLLAELAVGLVRNGTAGRQMLRQQEIAAQRQRMAAEHFAGLDYQARPTSPLLWLKLPPPWRPEAFAAQARQAGIIVGPAPIFYTGRGEPPGAVRLGLGGAGGETLAQALATLAELALRPPEESIRIV